MQRSAGWSRCACSTLPVRVCRVRLAQFQWRGPHGRRKARVAREQGNGRIVRSRSLHLVKWQSKWRSRSLKEPVCSIFPCKPAATMHGIRERFVARALARNVAQVRASGAQGPSQARYQRRKRRTACAREERKRPRRTWRGGVARTARRPLNEIEGAHQRIKYGSVQVCKCKNSYHFLITSDSYPRLARETTTVVRAKGPHPAGPPRAHSRQHTASIQCAQWFSSLFLHGGHAGSTWSSPVISTSGTLFGNETGP